MSKTRVFLVDDHTLLRSGLKLLIEGAGDMQVVGEAGTLQNAIELAAKTSPDVITLDLSMPGGSALPGVERLLRAAPGARILVLTMHDDPAYVRTAIALGASGFLAKSAADTELITAIRAVARGRTFVDTQSQGTLQSIFGAGAAEQARPAPISTLSDREREVLAEVARGYTSQQIADRVGLSVKTIESYRARLMQKLGLKNRADLMRLAVEAGFLSPADQP